MNPAIAHPESKAFSGRLRQRLAELGVAVISVSHDGACELVCPCRWEHALIIRSKPFIAAVRARLGELTDASAQLIHVLHGAGLVPMRTPVESPSNDHPHTRPPVLVAVLLGHELPRSEHFHRICDAGGLDYRATIAKIDADALMSCQEMQRTAKVIGWMARDAGDLGWRLHELHDLSWELAGSYEELSLLYKLSTSMVVDHPPQDFLGQACNEMREVVGLRWLAIQLLPEEPGFAELSVPVCVDGRSSFDVGAIRALGPQLIQAMAGRTEPMILDDASVLGIPGLEQLAHSLLITPLHVEGKPLGLLYGADKIDPDSGLSTVDSKLCASLGSSLSIYLKNVLLYEDMHSMFLGTLHALSTTIDAKDSYTYGHSERVALMSRQLAAAAGLDDHTVERVYLSGLVHDVGKIGVPEAVLTKPGRLTKEEFDLVKKHPEIGARIIERIRQMQDLIPGVLHHHESWDGRGYPYGLAGRDIPLFGRIIGLADAYDAMSSDRTYRRAMPMHKVLDEIRRCSGKQFDPDLADVFVGLDFSEYLDMIERHHDLLGPDPADQAKPTE